MSRSKWIPELLVGLVIALVVAPCTPGIANALTPPSPSPPSGFVSVTDFGARGDGRTDNAPAIQAALDAANRVFFPAGDYLIKTNLRLNDGNILQGDPQASRIVIDDSFVKRAGWAPGYAAIYNAHFGAAYNPNTADAMEIRGLRVSMTGTSAMKVTAIMAFANVKRLVVDDCDLLCAGTLGSVNGLDLYAGCQNVSITNNTIRTLNGASHGGPLLIRNECIGNGDTTVTRAVSVIGNHLESNEGDEMLNVCGDDGPTEDVTIQNNTFHHLSGGTRPVVSIAMYAAGNYKGVLDPPTAALTDVLFDHNSVIIDDFSCDGIRVGNASDTTHVVDNVSITNNTVTCAMSGGTGSIIRCEPASICRNVVVAGNSVSSTGTSLITYGIACVEEVRNNILSGRIRDGFAYCGAVRDNVMQGIGEGFGTVDCSLVTGNTISNVAVGVECEKTATYQILGNAITPAEGASTGAIYGNSLNGTVNPSLVARGNTINLQHAGSIGIRLEGHGFCGLGDNQWNGVGTYASLPSGAQDALAPSTKQSGADDAWHRGPVTVVLTVTDPESGVKSTEYRLDGGAWTDGTRALVGGDGVHALGYRSTDNAGNVETEKTASIRFDTTSPLASVSGNDESWHSSSVTLMFSASDPKPKVTAPVASASSGVAYIEYKVGLAGAWKSGAAVEVDPPANARTTTNISYRAVDGTGNIQPEKTCDVKFDTTSAPLPVDTTAPVTTTHGADNAWHKTPVSITFTAEDSGADAVGVAYTEYQVDGGTWTVGSGVTLAALANHSFDGAHVIGYRSADTAEPANVEDAHTCTVRIDTTGPTTMALATVRVKKGRTATLKYRINDALSSGVGLSPAATVTIVVQASKSKTVKRLTLGTRATNTPLSFKWTCGLKKGNYRFLIYATDLAGNRQASVGSNRLVVR